jgi:sporulation protein YlmC with PRC-barrel domain
MRSSVLVMGLLASSIFVSAASAQQMNNTAPPGAAPRAVAAKVYSDHWRASKLMGLDIYNDQNEKLGDINEILLDKTGKVDSVIIGVGGFLGVGTRDIKVSLDQLKFVNEPVRSASTTTTTTTTAANTPATTTDSRPATVSSTPSKQWYPDHAVLSGASKDQLKSMPEFKYD